MDFIRQHFKNQYKNEISDQNEEAINAFTQSNNGTVLNDSDLIVLNRELTLEELLFALKKSKNNSSPGSDGLPSEVYKFFWNDLKDPLLSCFNYSFEKGTLCTSQTTGIICLHHKGKGLAREIIGN